MEDQHLNARTLERDCSDSPMHARPHTPGLAMVASGHTHYGIRNASHIVLHITELLERVLSYLPPRKIFTIQRVSRYWKMVITASPELQEILFLRPRPADRPLEIWEVVTFEKTPIPTDMRDGGPREHVCPTHTCHRKVKIRQVSQLREGVNNDDEDDLLFLPVKLNPLMGLGQAARRPLVSFDGGGISCSTAVSASERISYHGTMALLEQYASMYLTSPPMLEAYVKVVVYYRDADASPSATPVRAELFSIKVESSTGVQSQGFIEGTHNGKSFGCDIFGLWEDDQHFQGRAFDSEDWNRNQQETTLAGLDDAVREVHGWARAVRDPTFQLETFLEKAAWKGLQPIVPTPEE